MTEDTRTVRYVGPLQAGVTIDATGDRVRPADSKVPLPVDDSGEELEVPDTADVPPEIAARMVEQDIWEPVGWSPDGDEHTPASSDDSAGGGDAGGISEVPSGTVDEVLTWVDGDPERAAAALEVETATKDRTTLVEELQDLADTTETEE